MHRLSKIQVDTALFFSARKAYVFNGTVSDSSTGTHRKSNYCQWRWHSELRQTRKKWRHWQARDYSTWPPNDRKVLSPYDIMGIRPGDAYSKLRFYDLVKLYHPDNTRSPIKDSIPKEERVARYRLVVEAHAILLNDQKRLEYDKHGIGWTTSRSLSPRVYPYKFYAGASSYSNSSTGKERDRGEEMLFGKLLFENKIFRCFVYMILIFAQSCLFLSFVGKAGKQTRQIDHDCKKLLHRHHSRALSTRSLMAQMERLLLKRDPSGQGCTLFEESFYREMLPHCAYQ